MIRSDLQPDLKDSKPLRVTVVGHQWWWEYRYDSYGDDKLGFITANELHVPASNRQARPARRRPTRRPVFLTLQSADVAHSFWVPRLAGKTDLIPGRTNTMWFETERTGVAGRSVCRILRHAARQHAFARLRRSARGISHAG